jgi:type IV pilus assembly protein PilQ
VITADNREANIKIATQEPIPNFTFNQQTASFVISGFEYKDVGNMLKVTPHVSNVNGEKFITMDVEPQVSTAAANGRSFNLPGGSVTVPLISVRTLTSRVMVKDGNTLALGGLLATQANRTYSKVPFFGDIPLFGELFRSRSFNKTKQNLLVFITPTVIASDGGTGLEDQYAQLKEDDENDRFAYRKSFTGNAKPRDQFRKGPEPTGLPIVRTKTGSGYDEKSKAMEEVSKDLESTPQVNPEQLAPRLAPSLRE